MHRINRVAFAYAGKRRTHTESLLVVTNEMMSCLHGAEASGVFPSGTRPAEGLGQEASLDRGDWPGETKFVGDMGDGPGGSGGSLDLTLQTGHRGVCRRGRASTRPSAGPGHPLLVDEVRLGHHQASSLSPMCWPEVLALSGPPTLAWPFAGNLQTPLLSAAVPVPEPEALVTPP